MTYEQSVERLRELDSQIRDFRPRRSLTEVSCNRCLRSLTEEEWREVVALIEEHEFPCYIESSPYGFAFEVRDHGVVQGEMTELLLLVEDTQFPFPSASRGFEGQVATLHLLQRLVYRPRNGQLLAWYGFKPLKAVILDYVY